MEYDLKLVGLSVLTLTLPSVGEEVMLASQAIDSYVENVRFFWI